MPRKKSQKLLQGTEGYAWHESFPCSGERVHRVELMKV